MTALAEIASAPMLRTIRGVAGIPGPEARCLVRLEVLEAAFGVSKSTMARLRRGEITLAPGLEIPRPVETPCGPRWFWPDVESVITAWAGQGKP